MDFVGKLLQPALRDRLEEYLASGRTRGPVIVELDPTTACQFACPTCISAPLLNRGHIPTPRLLGLLDEFRSAGVLGLILIGGGEPLAHPAISQVLDKAYHLGMAVGLTTNGLLIDRHLDRIAQCVAWTRVSVDAACESTFAALRAPHRGRAFDRVLSNMRLLSKSAQGTVGFSFLVTELQLPSGTVVSNVDELLDAAVLARDLGCDYFEYKPTVDRRHYLQPLSPRGASAIDALGAELERLNSPSFRVIPSKSMTHLAASEMPEQPKDYSLCAVANLRTVVTPTGIYICPYKRGLDTGYLGDIDRPFDQHWKSNERRRCAARVMPRRDCGFYCIRHDVNLALGALASADAAIVDLLPAHVSSQADDVFI